MAQLHRRLDGTTGQSVRIGGEAFDIDLYALTLGEYDMVLGV